MPTMDARVLTDEADGLEALRAALGPRRTGFGGVSAVARPAPALPLLVGAPRRHVRV